MAQFEIITAISEFAFMRRALVGSMALAMGCAPVGVLLLLRRMSLFGDALSHAVLPGAAIGFLLGGLTLPWLAGGGLIAGLLVALAASVAARKSRLNEDASFAGFYLLALAIGVLIVSKWGSSVDLIHLLFGSVLAIDDPSLLIVSGVASITLLWLAIEYRGIVLECADSGFIAATSGNGMRFHIGFMVIAVLNFVAAFQAMGTLMAVGLMMLPAATARLWVERLPMLFAVSWLVALFACIAGLIASYQWDLPSGPAIVLIAGGLYCLSLLFAPFGLFIRRKARHHAV
ncbi:metal ABC transporter permease [Iodobacter fluviatilis]|uniref:Manganese transport system membrane protein mntB n=1 Tax=Iodobacter fluviatilis TaxID=537 RepID=A0A377Q9T0_9NEIS|nr:metal ABC transporter permease [Iodobacter fluviatilis]TCU88454.1 zinc/manganese transport system permease protein [Iodobacter fluviatilis]STQ91475.1 Manganese transport system membrane protein mntB [Iodobacter fluviatilis]